MSQNYVANDEGHAIRDHRSRAYSNPSGDNGAFNSHLSPFYSQAPTLPAIDAEYHHDLAHQHHGQTHAGEVPAIVPPASGMVTGQPRVMYHLPPIYPTHDEGNSPRRQGAMPLPQFETEASVAPPSQSTEDPKKDKRRVQNRAAQKTFREKRIKHLKNLEEKAALLEELSQSWSDIIHKLWSDNTRLRAASGMDTISFEQWMADSGIAIPSASIQRFIFTRRILPFADGADFSHVVARERSTSASNTEEPSMHAMDGHDPAHHRLNTASSTHSQSQGWDWGSPPNAQGHSSPWLVKYEEPHHDHSHGEYERMEHNVSSPGLSNGIAIKATGVPLNGLYNQASFMAGVRGMGFA